MAASNVKLPVGELISSRVSDQPAVASRDEIETLRAAADEGDGDALLDYAMFFRDGCRTKSGEVLVKRSTRKERELVERAVAAGNRYAHCYLADLLSAKGASSAQMTKAVALYRRGYQLGDVVAAFNCGVTYLNRERHRDAVKWFRLAAARGDTSALLEVARAELYGLGTPRKPAAAVAKLTRVSRATAITTAPIDRESAMLVLANALMTGWGLPRDHAAGIKWLQRAAALGSATARGYLADEGMDAPTA